jgi:hypothetical protein
MVGIAVVHEKDAAGWAAVMFLHLAVPLGGCCFADSDAIAAV